MRTIEVPNELMILLSFSILLVAFFSMLLFVLNLTIPLFYITWDGLIYFLVMEGLLILASILILLLVIWEGEYE